MFADLQINSSNFRGLGGSDLKPSAHYTRLQPEPFHSQISPQYSAQKHQSRIANAVRPSAKSEVNSHKSDYSGMIRKSGGGSVSQKTQTTAHSNTESANEDQQSSLIMQKLQKLPTNSPWSDKQEILRGKISKLATTQTGSRYLQNQLTKSNPVLIEFLLQEVGHQLASIMVN